MFTNFMIIDWLERVITIIIKKHLITIMVLIFLFWIGKLSRKELQDRKEEWNKRKEESKLIMEEAAENDRKQTQLLEVLVNRQGQVANKEDIEKYVKSLSESIDNQILKYNNSITGKINDNKDKINNTLFQNLKEINEKAALFDQSNKNFKDLIDGLKNDAILNLKNDIDHFSKILFDKKKRGVYGEAQLSQIIFAIYGDNIEYYKEQYEIERGKIVDLAIFIPNNLIIPIDSKFSLENFIKYQNNPQDKQALSRFKQDIKTRINETSSYIVNGKTTEYAIMFIPSESIFSFIYGKAKDLIEYARLKNVLVVSPTTMSAVVSNIKHTTKIIAQTEKSKEIREDLKKLGDDFKRFAERWNQLEKKIQEIVNKKKDFGTSVSKIEKKFNKIKEGK